MVFPIVLYGSSVLRKVAGKIDKDYEYVNEFIESMFETLKVADGIGLAAPQVGRSIRLFVVDTSPLAKDDPALKDFKKVFINPEIIEEEGEESEFNEGCLSIPDIREDVIRSPKIRIQYYDGNFEFHDELFDGKKARIIQHEYDHLDGILFTDKIPPLKKRMLAGKLNAISRGKVDVKYKVKIPKYGIKT